MEVMIHIKQVFINLELVKGLERNQVVKVEVNGRVTTWKNNTPLAFISELNPT
jgi:hypothetical protein